MADKRDVAVTKYENGAMCLELNGWHATVDRDGGRWTWELYSDPQEDRETSFKGDGSSHSRWEAYGEALEALVDRAP